MLERLEISDYRSCINTVIDLQPDLTVLIGPNGGGKTNILKAILLLRDLTHDSDRDYRSKEGAVNECRLKASFRCNNKKAILTANIQVVADEYNADEIYGSEQSWFAKEFTGSGKRITIPLWVLRSMFLHSKDLDADRFSDIKMRHYLSQNQLIDFDFLKSFKDPITKITEFLCDIKYYGASQLANPSLCPVSFEVLLDEEDFFGRSQRTRHDKFLRALYGAKDTPSFLEFFNVIGPGGLRLVDNIKFKEIPTSTVHYSVRSGGKVVQRKVEKIIVVPQFVVGRDVLSPSQLSEGTFKTITLLFYLMTEHSSALLIEEPEVCVHHGLLSSIVELIKTYSKKKQIIVSTHSDFVLDQVEPRNVYKVSRAKKEGTVVTQIEKSISSEELKALKVYLETEGNLGEYWRHGRFEESS